MIRSPREPAGIVLSGPSLAGARSGTRSRHRRRDRHRKRSEPLCVFQLAAAGANTSDERAAWLQSTVRAILSAFDLAGPAVFSRPPQPWRLPGAEHPELPEWSIRAHYRRGDAVQK